MCVWLSRSYIRVVNNVLIIYCLHYSVFHIMVSDSQSFVLMVGYASNTVCFLDEISKIKTILDKIINCLEYLRNNYSIISYILDFLHTFRWFLKSFMEVARSETKIYWYLKIKLLSSKPLIKSFYNVRTFF